MKAVSLSVLGAVLSGLLAYLAVRWLWPAIAVQNFTNVIGVIALVGASIGAWWARRGASTRPSPPPSQPPAKRKRGHRG